MKRSEGLKLRLNQLTTINIARDINLDGDYPKNLRLKRTCRTLNLYAHFLPTEKNDPRPYGGRSRGGVGKRITYSKSMKTHDPLLAAERAIVWSEDLMDSFRSCQKRLDQTLPYYWNSWFATQCAEREHKRNFARWKRDTKAKWEGSEYGIRHQQWAHKQIDEITSKDFANYFALLTKRGKTTRASGIKEQQKTLINHLFDEARNTNFERLITPKFPNIGRDKKQTPHLTNEQFGLILKTIIDKSGGIANTKITNEEYNALQHTPYRDENIRNWVDLYDALCLEWFFYLRAEDMVRLRGEWFTRNSNHYVCELETTKKDRPKHMTHSFRPDADRFCEKLLARKPDGYLIFPDKIRPENNEAGTNVLRKLNKLLKTVLQTTVPAFPKEYMKWTTIRHTAFRLTLEDDPTLGVSPKIDSFAYNGHTSAQQLRDTYLKHISPEEHSEETRSNIPMRDWSLMKRVKVM